MRIAVLVLPLAACTTLAPGDHLDAGLRGDPRAVLDGSVVRVVSWNVETLGAVGSTEYEAAQQILARLDADVVALQEVQWDLDEHVLAPFAADAGYPHVVSGWPVRFGDDTQVILSRHPVIWSALVDADDLQPGANDMTRATPVAALDIDGIELVVSTGHLKSGSRDSDEFRRTVDAVRAVQALGDVDPAFDRVLFCGDLNDDLNDGGNGPATFTSVPSGTPWSYDLGDDLWAQLEGPGLANDTFAPFRDAGLHAVDARQLDGDDATRPASGRRLDYVWVTEPLLDGLEAEVYDTWDEGLGGLPKAGPVPTHSTLTAADHLPVVVDLRWPTDATGPDPVEPTGELDLFDLGRGDLRVREVMADPEACPDEEGEWVEVQSLASAPVDLTGLELCDAHACGLVAFSAPVLAPGGVALLARTDGGCGLATAGTFEAALSNGGDEVALVGAERLDAVTYTSTDAGVSWVYDDEGDCKGVEGGTPGEALACDGSPLGPEIPAEPWALSEVPDGALILQEILPNPADCADEQGEWVELHNTGDRAIDLTGLQLADEAGAETVATTRVLEPGGHALFARTAEACGLPFVDGTFALALSNGGDTVQVRRPDGAVLDTLGYSSAPSGQSLDAEGTWGVPTPGR